MTGRAPRPRGLSGGSGDASPVAPPAWGTWRLPAGPSSALALAVLLLALPGRADEHPTAPAPKVPAFERADVKAVAARITCYCGCPHMQVSKCFCGTADQMRQDIAAGLDGGATAEQVIAQFVQEHGNWILANPPRQGFNWIIWLGPPAVLLAGAVGATLLARRWRAEAPLAAASHDQVQPEDEERLRARMEEELSRLR